MLDYFQEMLMIMFLKNPKKLLGGNLRFFLPKFRRKCIFMEKGLSQFLKVPIVYDRAKNKKKNNGSFLKKIPN